MAAANTDVAEPIPAIGYIRVSTAREEMISPELQRSAIEQWAARRNRKIIDWVEDLDATGRNFKRKIMKAIGYIEDGTAQEIAVWKYNRFGRNDVGIAVNLARIEAVGGALQSATEEVDASTATGWFQRDMLFSVATFESKRAGEDWKSTHQHRRSQGLPAGGGDRFGYIWHPRRLPHPDKPGQWITQQERYEIDPDTAPIVREMYQRYAAGTASALGLARELNKADVPNPKRGKPWEGKTVSWLLDSGFAAGLLHVHQSQVRCVSAEGCARLDHYDYLPGAQPPIITPGQWEAYLQRRKAVSDRMASRHPASVYLLTGIARCGHCRKYMEAIKAREGGRMPAYRCSTRAKRGTGACVGVRVRMEEIHAEVRDWVAGLAADVDAEAGTLPMPESKAAMAEDPAAARARLVAAEESLTRAMTDAAVRQAKAGSRLPEDVYAATIRELTREREDVQRRLQALPVGDAPQLGRTEYVTVARGLLRDWEVLDGPGRRAMLAGLVLRVAVFQEEGAVRTRRGLPCRVEVHPRWEPDPWV